MRRGIKDGFWDILRFLTSSRLSKSKEENFSRDEGGEVPALVGRDLCVGIMKMIEAKNKNSPKGGKEHVFSRP
jgi:hypothetical protein